MRSVRWFLFAILVVAVSPAVGRAQTDLLRIARLSALGRLFGVVKYFHPAFLERDVAWDSAVVVAIDAVNAAKTSDDYRAAITNVLRVLDDPATRVVAASGTMVAMQSSRTPAKRWEVSGPDSTLVIAIPDFENFGDATSLLNA